MPARVYYLDDETLLLKQFDRFMTGKGLESRVFEQADAFIAACREVPPDVVFLDFRLADTTGLAVAKELDSAIKKVLVTGELTVDEGPDFAAVLSKPFRLSEAVALVDSLLANG